MPKVDEKSFEEMDDIVGKTIKEAYYVDGGLRHPDEVSLIFTDGSAILIKASEWISDIERIPSE